MMKMDSETLDSSRRGIFREAKTRSIGGPSRTLILPLACAQKPSETKIGNSKYAEPSTDDKEKSPKEASNL